MDEDNSFLGHEFLTWLLWRADKGDSTFSFDGDDFSVAFTGRVCLGGLGGDVVKGRLDGQTAAYSVEVRAAIGAGRTVREATLKFTAGVKEWTCSLTDTFDLRSVKLPALLTEEEDDRFGERMALLTELEQMVQAMYAVFMLQRSDAGWLTQIVPAIGAWVSEGLAVE